MIDFHQHCEELFAWVIAPAFEWICNQLSRCGYVLGPDRSRDGYSIHASHHTRSRMLLYRLDFAQRRQDSYLMSTFCLSTCGFVEQRIVARTPRGQRFFNLSADSILANFMAHLESATGCLKQR